MIVRYCFLTLFFVVVAIGLLIPIASLVESFKGNGK
jgi:hypothetical protein